MAEPLVALALLALPAAAAEPPDLGGIWQLDRERSEDPWDKLRAAGARVRQDRGGLDGRRLPDVSRLVIRHREPEVTIFYPDGGRRQLFTDGRQLEAEMEQGYIQASARWKGSKLVFSGEKVEGATVWVAWEVDGEQLLVTTRLSGGRGGGKLSFRRVYDRQSAVTGGEVRPSDGVAVDEPPSPDPR